MRQTTEEETIRLPRHQCRSRVAEACRELANQVAVGDDKGGSASEVRTNGRRAGACRPDNGQPRADAGKNQETAGDHPRIRSCERAGADRFPDRVTEISRSKEEMIGRIAISATRASASIARYGHRRSAGLPAVLSLRGFGGCVVVETWLIFLVAVSLARRAGVRRQSRRWHSAEDGSGFLSSEGLRALRIELARVNTKDDDDRQRDKTRADDQRASRFTTGRCAQAGMKCLARGRFILRLVGVRVRSARSCRIRHHRNADNENGAY